MTDQNDEMPANASKFLELSDELQQTDADRKRKGLAGKTEASSSNRRCSCGDVFEKGDDGYACRSCGLMPKGGLIDDGPAHRHFADDPDSYNKDHHQIVYEPITPNIDKLLGIHQRYLDHEDLTPNEQWAQLRAKQVISLLYLCCASLA